MEVTENGADDLWNAGKSMLMLSAADASDPVVVTDNDEKMMLSTDTELRNEDSRLYTGYTFSCVTMDNKGSDY